MEEEWRGNYNKASEDKKLELRLAPPGQFLNRINIGAKRDRIEEKSTEDDGDDEKQCKRFSCCDILISSPWSKKSSKSSTFQNLKEIQNEEQEQKLQCLEMKARAGPATATATASNHKRPETSRFTASTAAGWPPIRSFRRNLGSSRNNSKLEKKNSAEDDLFVKINVEGVPIGRKINLNAYDSYQKLSVAIDELFRGLLAAQRESCGAKEIDVNENESREYTYTLVYEDSDGDTILVGDVPWQVFISTAKRLRVLKSSEISTPRRECTFCEKVELLSFN